MTMSHQDIQCSAVAAAVGEPLVHFRPAVAVTVAVVAAAAAAVVVTAVACHPGFA